MRLPTYKYKYDYEKIHELALRGLNNKQICAIVGGRPGTINGIKNIMFMKKRIETKLKQGLLTNEKQT